MKNLILNKTTSMKERVWRLCHKARVSTLVGAGLFLTGNAFAGNPPAGGGLFSGAYTAAQTDFGASSKFWTFFILAEVVVGLAAYIKTKNMMSLVGVAIVSIFINVAILLVFPS